MTTVSHRVFAFLMISVCTCPQSTIAFQPIFQGLGDLPGGTFRSTAAGISADGSTVIGTSSSFGGFFCGDESAFRWRNGVMTPLGIPNAPGYCSRATAVSSDGSVVGGQGGEVFVGHSSFRSMLWRDDGVFASTGGDGSNFSGVSGDGSRLSGNRSSGVRTAWYTDFTAPAAFQTTYSGESDSLSGGISQDGTTVVGVDFTGPFKAFRWQQGGSVQFLAGMTIANATSADGGFVVGETNGGLAGRWTVADGAASLGDLSGGVDSSSALATDPSGWYVVGTGTTATGAAAFIWDPIYGMRNLADVLTNVYGLNLLGFTLTNATGISADGMTIVGNSTNASGNSEAWIAMIPEPASLALFAGMVLLLPSRRARVSR